MFWPAFSLCEVCRRWGRESVCKICARQFLAKQMRCLQCALPISAAAPLCGACLQQAPSFSGAVCVADYSFPWDRLIVDLKFHRRPELAKTLATLLADAVISDGRPLPDLVLPVPLSAQRLAERGYNQTWELARCVAQRLSLACDGKLLQRVIDTPHQAALNRAKRLANLKAAFVIDRARDVAFRGQHIALVDDVLTTGATVEECSRTLLRNGAASVCVWVLARTPAPQT